jgi:glycyl-tRNA synthetase beta chain
MKDTLLVEILTEELPPKALARLMEAFSHALFEGLKDKHFLPPEAEFTPFATPRRLAVLISGVLAKQADRVVERKGPALASALDASGQPTPALLGLSANSNARPARRAITSCTAPNRRASPSRSTSPQSWKRH